MHPEPAAPSAALDPRTYPELAPDAGDPLVGLDRIAAAEGVTLAPTRPWGHWDAAQDPLSVAVDSDRGTCVVEFERQQHAIRVRFTRPWIGDAATAANPTLHDTVALLDAWHRHLPLEDMARRWPALAVAPFALALEQGRALSYRWQEVRSLPDRTIDRNLIEAVYAAPRLRALYPLVSHGSLTFSDTPLPPHPHHFPRANPHGEHGWLVGDPRQPASVHTPAATAEAAVAALIRLLPDAGDEHGAPEGNR
ncbi:DUF6193 family natural product biosynthesis protein [Streptomyces sp. 12297]